MVTAPRTRMQSTSQTHFLSYNPVFEHGNRADLGFDGGNRADLGFERGNCTDLVFEHGIRADLGFERGIRADLGFDDGVFGKNEDVCHSLPLVSGR